MMSNISSLFDECGVSVALLVLAAVSLVLLYVLRLRHYNLLKKYVDWQDEAEAVEFATHDALHCEVGEEEAEGSGYPFISIVVPINHFSTNLDEQLQALFSQQYAGQFDVVLADEEHSADTKEMVKRYKEQYADLRSTFVPETSRNIERRKLALTLGIRASRGEWVIVVSAESMPVNHDWLQHYAQHLTSDVDFVQAYSNYEDDGSMLMRRAIYERVTDFATRLHAYEDGVSLFCNNTNWAVRKDWFFAQQGFSDSLLLAFGEEAIFVNRHVDAERSALLCSPTTKMNELLPSKHLLNVNRVQHAEVKRWLSGAARKYAYTTSIASWMAYVNVLSLLTYCLWRLIALYMDVPYGVGSALTDFACLLLCVGSVLLPLKIGQKGLHALHERKMGVYPFTYNLLRPWHTLSVIYERWGHQRDFERKFL